jgi:RimJ/RimL family protein N-acetyltransferase
VIFETERLRFRELVSSDLDFVFSMLGDPRVMRFYPKVLSREESQAWIDRQRTRYREQGWGLWLAIEKATGDPVGQIGLVRQTISGGPEDEIGYLLAASAWGKGFATEGARGTRDLAFGPLGRARVISLIRPENVPSQKVALRTGLSPGMRVPFVGLEHIVFSLERDEWRAGSKEPEGAKGVEP